MAVINTRNHIVLDKEDLRNYADMLNIAYGAIIEINTEMDAYQMLFDTQTRFPGMNAGTGKELLRTVKQYVHQEDRKTLMAAFRRKKLQNIIRNHKYEAIEFRGLSSEGDFRWMRAFLIPDETVSDTIFCLLLDIELQKQCKKLEKENQELRKRLRQYEQQQEPMKRKTVKSGKKRFGLPLYKRAIRSSAETPAGQAE